MKWRSSSLNIRCVKLQLLNWRVCFFWKWILNKNRYWIIFKIQNLLFSSMKLYWKTWILFLNYNFSVQLLPFPPIPFISQLFFKQKRYNSLKFVCMFIIIACQKTIKTIGPDIFYNTLHFPPQQMPYSTQQYLLIISKIHTIKGLWNGFFVFLTRNSLIVFFLWKNFETCVYCREFKWILWNFNKMFWE